MTRSVLSTKLAAERTKCYIHDKRHDPNKALDKWLNELPNPQSLHDLLVYAKIIELKLYQYCPHCQVFVMPDLTDYSITIKVYRLCPNGVSHREITDSVIPFLVIDRVINFSIHSYINNNPGVRAILRKYLGTAYGDDKIESAAIYILNHHPEWKNGVPDGNIKDLLVMYDQWENNIHIRLKIRSEKFNIIHSITNAGRPTISQMLTHYDLRNTDITSARWTTFITCLKEWVNCGKRSGNCQYSLKNILAAHNWK